MTKQKSIRAGQISAQSNNFISSTPWQYGRYFTDNVLRCIFMNEKFCILIEMSLKFVPKGPIDNSPALV